MTRKRIRYSELAQPPAAPASAPAPEELASDPAPVAPVAPANVSAPVEPVALHVEPIALHVEPEAAPLVPEWNELDLIRDEPLVLESTLAPLIEGRQPPPRPKRNSTPVELARALAAERAAAVAQEGSPATAPTPGFTFAETAIDEGPKRSLREMARRRDGVEEMLMFRVGGERFAVELVLVDEVIDLPVIHHVPEMPPAMIGVVTVRGSLTPVYSPRQALGLALALRDALLIFRRGGHRVGILIDDVDDATSIDMSELRETMGGDQPDSVLLGVVRIASALVGIVDAHALIAACQSADILETA